MAISFRSVMIGFFMLIVYYGLFFFMGEQIEYFKITHGNPFDIFLVVLMPLIIFGTIVFYALKGDSNTYYPGQ